MYLDRATAPRSETVGDLEKVAGDLEQAPEDPDLLARKQAIRSIIARLDDLLGTERIIVPPTRSG